MLSRDFVYHYDSHKNSKTKKSISFYLYNIAEGPQEREYVKKMIQDFIKHKTYKFDFQKLTNTDVEKTLIRELR